MINTFFKELFLIQIASAYAKELFSLSAPADFAIISHVGGFNNTKRKRGVLEWLTLLMVIAASLAAHVKVNARLAQSALTMTASASLMLMHALTAAAAQLLALLNASTQNNYSAQGIMPCRTCRLAAHT